MPGIFQYLLDERAKREHICPICQQKCSDNIQRNMYLSRLEDNRKKKKQMEENEETQEVLARFENTGTSIFTAEFAVLTQLTGFKLTRGMLCALKRRPLEDLIQIDTHWMVYQDF